MQVNIHHHYYCILLISELRSLQHWKLFNMLLFPNQHPFFKSSFENSCYFLVSCSNVKKKNIGENLRQLENEFSRPFSQIQNLTISKHRLAILVKKIFFTCFFRMWLNPIFRYAIKKVQNNSNSYQDQRWPVHSYGGGCHRTDLV